jgi:hypothetical protein
MMSFVTDLHARIQKSTWILFMQLIIISVTDLIIILVFFEVFSCELLIQLFQIL